MGVYNPHVPDILGEEWVGIRNEDLTFSPAVNVVERGHRFSFTGSRTLVDGRFYLSRPPDGESANQVYMINVYPANLEAESGPIRRVVIPVNAAGATGAAFSIGGSAPSATNYPTVLNGYGGSILVQPSANTTAKTIALFFATSQYSQLLNGKRIVGVNLLHGLSWDPVDTNTGDVAEQIRPFVLGSALRLATGTGAWRTISYSPDVTVYSANDGVSVIGFDSLLASGTVDIGRSGQITTHRIGLGETNFLWSTPAFTNTDDVMPWRYDELLRFEATAGANRMWVQYDFGGTVQFAGSFRLAYAALEVLFCEERRVAYGGLNCSAVSANPNLNAYDPGLVPITLRSTAFAASPVLAAGDYSVTVSSADVGDVVGASQVPSSEPAKNNPYPGLAALRQLYPMPAHTGIQVNLTQTEHDVFSLEEVDVLPQLSLHTSSGPTVEPHGYGRQAWAQVWGTITATQEILDAPAGGAASYPQVRFYARRYGTTTVPLRLDSTNITGAGVFVQITPDDFDELPEIMDGWKDVTLRFGTAPSMGTGAITPLWRWSATGELHGSRWEVLGVSAPAISGVPGNLLNLAPAAHQLGATTYGGPSNGATINAEWMPGHSPLVSGTTADPATDMVILFSQDPATITGVGVTQLTQELTTYTECETTPCCVPSALQYHRITWSQPGTPVAANFGAYELQRMDATETEWKTIMLATSQAVTGFNDYEPRVGISSTYRIRQLNVYDFAGQWSSEVSHTLDAPGVTLPSCGTDRRGVLIFTTNEVQDGSRNLAYAMTWEGSPEETFSFVETNEVQTLTFFDQDYQVMFHGNERGGEAFSRTLLLSNAAVGNPRLADAGSLRDLAWDDLPYVCVRDDIGDRWLASVIVPALNVRRNRRLYNAAITVIEVTNTPSPVDP